MLENTVLRLCFLAGEGSGEEEGEEEGVPCFNGLPLGTGDDCWKVKVSAESFFPLFGFPRTPQFRFVKSC